MRIDSSGKVGIGTNSPDVRLHVADSQEQLTLSEGGSKGATFDYRSSTGNLNIATNGIDARANPQMTLDLAGTLLVGSSTKVSHGQPIVLQAGGGGAYFTIQRNDSLNVVEVTTLTNTPDARTHYNLQNSNGTVGTIQTAGSSTSYNTSSDYRLKTDAQPMTGASARVQALNPVNFEWIADGTRVDGFLAHEAQEVVPESVAGTKDAMQDEEYEVTPAVRDDDGNVTTEAVMGTRSVPEYQGIDQSKLVPLLTAALQEALTEIASLKTRVEALEA